MLNLAWNQAGDKLLYENEPCTLENMWRKHQDSSAARDICLFDPASGTYEQLTQWKGDDRDPQWSADGKSMFWLSERSGSLNIWSRELQGGEPVQVSRHQKWPVRFLSSASDGTLVYAWNGEIWRIPAGSQEGEVVPVFIRQSSLVDGVSVKDVTPEVNEFVISKDGSQAALVAHGEVFVLSMKGDGVRRITNTPQMERMVDFAPDGRGLAYASERGGDWDIIEASLTQEGDASFAGAAPYEEKVLIGGGGDSYAPEYSPQGDKLAYLESRTELRVFDKKSGNSAVAQSGDKTYSYNDGDVLFKWAPDGRWLITQTGFGDEVSLVSAESGKESVNLSNNGFADGNPKMSADGKIALWVSDREGLKSVTFGGAQQDIYAAFLTKKSLDLYKQGIEEDQKKPSEVSSQQEAVLPEVDGLSTRTIRLTPFSSEIAFYQLTPNNKHLIVVANQPNGMAVCYVIDARTLAMRTLFSGPVLPGGAYATDGEVKGVYVCSGGAVHRYDVTSGAKQSVPYRLEMMRDARAEVAGLFEHCWRITEQTFYQKEMHGVNWKEVGDHYRQFLPHLIHWEDVAVLLDEMVGELNASHQAARFHAPATDMDATGSLGVYWDYSHEGEGMKVAHVLANGPSDRSDEAIKKGTIILEVDGHQLGKDESIDKLLNGTVGKELLVRVRSASGEKNLKMRPVSLDVENVLAYERWVLERRGMVDKLSGGRLGYLHLNLMAPVAYKRAYGELFGPCKDKEAVIIDVRSNGGGNLHDQLITLLSGEHDSSLISREGVEIARNPIGRWTKPSCVMVNANSYSDGTVFPVLYQRKKIGPLVGERVPGTGTAVVRDPMINGYMDYGIPELGFRLTDGTFFENMEIVPEVLVQNDPKSIIEGKDLQLEAAVNTLLEKLKEAGASASE